MNFMLSDEQWAKLIEVNQALSDDFQMRRELLLTRLDVTIQSFKWADRLKKNNQEITNLYQKKRKDLSIRPSIKPFFVLAARDGNKKILNVRKIFKRFLIDLLLQEKTCSTRLMAKCELHKIIIPKVPDRGGRTGELQPPPPEMPAFMQRKSSAEPQGQRHQSGNDKRRYDNYSNKWKDQKKNFQPKGDFERFQDTDYHGGSGNSNTSYGGRGRGQRGGRGGGRNYHN